ncbi:MAG: hypothetical protein EBV45_07325 [Chloroflexi bacterium]|nr:hypothetical protein [Chloroflexota bacterium]
MATITTYTTLQSTIADYLNRADLTAQIPTFIQMAEADMNTRLRTREMIVRAVQMDPLTGALLPLSRIREMVGELFTAEARFLPQFS